MQIFPYFGLQVMTPAVLGENVHPIVVGGDVGRTDPALRHEPVRLPIALLPLEIACRRAHFSKRKSGRAKTGGRGKREGERERRRGGITGKKKEKMAWEKRGDDFSCSTTGRLFGRSSADFTSIFSFSFLLPERGGRWPRRLGRNGESPRSARDATSSCTQTTSGHPRSRGATAADDDDDDDDDGGGDGDGGDARDREEAARISPTAAAESGRTCDA